MNDRLRFRALNKEEQKYYYDVQDTYDFGNSHDKNHIATSFGDIIRDDRYIIEQCTGLKDRNDVLIYEGDILQSTHDLEWIAYVGYDSTEGCYYIECDESTDNFYLTYSDGFEVIGNIHTDKEMLK